MNVRRIAEMATYPMLVIACIGIATVVTRSFSTRTVHPTSAAPMTISSVHRKEGGAPARYRVVVHEDKDRNQVIQLYLTSQSNSNGKEFLAFEYSSLGNDSSSGP